MGFSIFCILESILLLANAFAILNERFLRKSKTLNFGYSSSNIVGLDVDAMKFNG